MVLQSCQDMCDDAASLRNGVIFLYLVQRVAEAIQAAPALRRVDAPLVRDLATAVLWAARWPSSEPKRAA